MGEEKEECRLLSHERETEREREREVKKSKGRKEIVSQCKWKRMGQEH